MRPAMVSGFHGKLPIVARATSIAKFTSWAFLRSLSLNNGCMDWAKSVGFRPWIQYMQGRCLTEFDRSYGCDSFNLWSGEGHLLR
jgi:hypothetical protein